MFVVNTTSATVSGASETRVPRKRVPSSRRRNPGRRSGCSLTGALLLLGAGWWRALFIGGLDRNGGFRRRIHGRGRRARRETLVENRRRRAAARGHQLQRERESEEEASSPPRNLRQDVACLTCADERVRGC